MIVSELMLLSIPSLFSVPVSLSSFPFCTCYTHVNMVNIEHRMPVDEESVKLTKLLKGDIKEQTQISPKLL
jgi:hypothetical protein